MTLEERIKARKDKLKKDQLKAKLCGEMVMFLKDMESNRFVAKTKMCGSDCCPVCGHLKKEKLIQKVSFLASAFKMINMVTITSSARDFKAIKKALKKIRTDMAMIEDPEYHHTRTGTKDKELGYNQFIEAIIDREAFAIWMFKCRVGKYLNRAHYSVLIQRALKEGRLHELMMKYGYKGSLTKYINEYYAGEYEHFEKYADIKKAKKGQSFYKHILCDLLYIIFKAQMKSDTKLSELIQKQARYRIDFVTSLDMDPVTKTIKTKHFSYVRTWEFQRQIKVTDRRPHFHLITNCYIPFYILERAETEECYIFDQGLFRDDTISHQTDLSLSTWQSSVNYMTKYILKDQDRYNDEVDALNGNNVDEDLKPVTYSDDVTKFLKITPGLEKEKHKYSYITEQQGSMYKDTVDLGTDGFEAVKMYQELLMPNMFTNKNKFYLEIKKLDDECTQKVNKVSKKDADVVSGDVGKKVTVNDLKKDIYHEYEHKISVIAEQWLRSEFEKRKARPVPATRTDIELSGLDNEQADAVRKVYNTNKPTFITGKAGRGKTTVIEGIIRNCSVKYLLSSYTGKATDRIREVLKAKGLSITCDIETIHSAGSSHFTYGIPCFRMHENRLLEHELVVVDEVSMADVLTLAMLLNAIPATATLVFVGDPYQLQPFKYSSSIPILKEYCEVVELKNNYRSGDKINNIAMSFFEEYKNDICEDYNTHREEIINLIKEGWVCLSASKDIVHTINCEITKDYPILNYKSGYHYKVGMEVMFLKNTDKYKNGTIDVITDFDSLKGVFSFAGGYQLDIYATMDTFVPCYCNTVHKYQGSEATNVILILDDKEKLANSNLVYTGVTRAKEKLKLYKNGDLDERKLYNNFVL